MPHGKTIKTYNNMKHIFFCLIILFAIQPNCLAQSYPEVSDIFKYFKDKGLIKAYNISNAYGNGYREEFKLSFVVDDALPEGTYYRNYRNNVKLPMEVLKGKQKLQTLDHIKRLFSNFMDKSVESYDYQYHTDKKDSIIQYLTFKVDHNDSVKVLNEISSSNGFMRFKYRAHRDESNNTKGVAQLSVRSYLDHARAATKPLDVDALLSKIEPILKDKSIKKRTIIFRFDDDFDGYQDKAARKNGFEFFSMTSKAMERGEYNMLVCKFTDEEKAMDVLHKVMACARNYVAENPKEGFDMLSHDYFGKDVAYLFQGGWFDSNFKSDNKRIIIETHMDTGGFYICLNYIKGRLYGAPHEGIDWKSVKEIVNGNDSYYDEKL